MLLKISRSGYYRKPKTQKPKDISILHRMDEIYTDHSFYGYRMIHKKLQEEGFIIGKNRVLKYMQILGIRAICPQKKKLTSIKNHEHKIYPYLLKEFYNEHKQVVAKYPNHIWSGDITYIRIAHGFIYLAAIIDWHSKSILAWKLSNTMDAPLTLDLLESTIEEYGIPEIFNSDQCSQYTSEKHIKILKNNGIRISMNGKGRSIDNIAIERFFRTLKYEDIYLNNYSSISDLRAGIAKYMDFYNYNRFHSALGYQKPMNVYRQELRIAA
jgi:putative transposase